MGESTMSKIFLDIKASGNKFNWAYRRKGQVQGPMRVTQEANRRVKNFTHRQIMGHGVIYIPGHHLHLQPSLYIIYEENVRVQVDDRKFDEAYGWNPLPRGSILID